MQCLYSLELQSTKYFVNALVGSEDGRMLHVVAISMQYPTYYTTLGLATNAPPEVIRAAYKALTLIYHPEKTLELPASARATHAAVFRNIQRAFDVLKSQNEKAAYDAELERRNGEIDEGISTFHHPCSSTSRFKTAVRLTTPEEKAAMIAQTRQQLDDFRMQRKNRQEEGATMNIAELNSLDRTWRELAEENASDPGMKAYCLIRAYEYQEKIQAREQEHEDWLKNLSKPKTASVAPVRPITPINQDHCPLTPDVPSKSAAAAFPSSPTAPITSIRALRFEASPTPTLSSRTKIRAVDRMRAGEKRTEETQARAIARREKKAQTEAKKQARIEEKAALIHEEKEKQKEKVQEQARLNAERIAKARAKVRVAPMEIGNVHDGVVTLEVSQKLSRMINASN